MHTPALDRQDHGSLLASYAMPTPKESIQSHKGLHWRARLVRGSFVGTKGWGTPGSCRRCSWHMWVFLGLPRKRRLMAIRVGFSWTSLVGPFPLDGAYLARSEVLEVKPMRPCKDKNVSWRQHSDFKVLQHNALSSNKQSCTRYMALSAFKSLAVHLKEQDIYLEPHITSNIRQICID